MTHSCVALIIALVQGSVRFSTADNPCGDYGDDRAGHGTHVAGSAAGRAFAPESHSAEVRAAAPYDGVAPGAKIFFTDVMLNADPACNLPESVCGRVDGVTVPVDVAAALFPAPYEAGARVRLFLDFRCSYVMS